ncbi:HNH endonuclease signature motif containing protein, partial [Subtercola boreus]|uniref:HNH endonuclease signature motif containing protein n=1 Tax=Subtercola boreus TaxID=120213 RepID=UPI0011C08384
GDIGVDVAEMITRRLTDVASRVGFTEEVEEAEGGLVSYAQDRVGGFGYSVREVDDLAIRYREHLDPDGAEPRDAELHERRYLTLTPHCSGMTRITGMLTAPMAGIIGAALEPFTSPRIVSFQPDTPDPDALDDDGVPGDAVTVDTRSAGQKRADGLVQLIELGAKNPTVPRLNGAAPTVNLHATLDDVTSGRGVGWIDGLTEPVPYTTVEALLCHADVITTLFGQHGQVLQHGKTRRLFTAAQNRALAARDGGCVWPGCNAPPSWCESHHVDGWLSPTHPGGLTDLDNGALLCHFHHSNVHKARWKLTIRNGTPHVIPPQSLDWNQTPRPCQQNRARQRKPGHHPPDHPSGEGLQNDHHSDTG